MRRLLQSILMIGLVSTIAFGLSSAFFSDTETSSNNLFQAGDLDLKVDNTSYYNGEFNPGTSWLASDLNDGNGPSNDLYKFFDFLDIKPGDWGEDTISLHVETNDAWACYNVELTSNDDNTCNEPELANDQSCQEPNDNLFDGELAQNVQFVLWTDDGDNVFETCDFNEAPNDCFDETPLHYSGPIDQVIPNLKGALADSNGGLLGLEGDPISGNQVYYLGKAWCFGELSFEPENQDGLGFTANEGANGPDQRNSGILCDGSALDNSTQTDILTADISFSAVQARNNPNFLCDDTINCEEGLVYTASVDSNLQGTLNNGGAITDPARTNPTFANGAPNGQFYSLGKNGWVILKFTGIVGTDGGANTDLSVYEITNGRDSYPEEKAQIEVSLNGSDWTPVGEASSEPGGGGDGVSHFNLDAFGITLFQYVRLTDSTNFGLHNSTADGYDLDAVSASYGACLLPN